MGIIGLLAAVFLALSSLIFFNLPKILAYREEEISKTKEIAETKITGKLLPEGSFEPIPSVTENSTELLFVENKTQKIK